jgi:hypothetical protein
MAVNGRFYLDLHEIKVVNEGIKIDERIDVFSHEPIKEP